MSDYLFFTHFGDYAMVGSNDTISSNGVLDVQNVPSIVEIPFDHDGKQVVEIGYRAFRGLESIREVIIKAQLYVIHDQAFYLCVNLEKINIPSSVHIIGTCAIDVKVAETNTRSEGTLSVYFEPFSQIKYIFHAGLCNKRKIVIYACENIQPEVSTYFLGGVESIVVFSPTSFVFCGYQTTRGSCVIHNLYVCNTNADISMFGNIYFCLFFIMSMY